MFVWNVADEGSTAWIYDGRTTTTRQLAPQESLGMNTQAGPFLVACSTACAVTARLVANGAPLAPLKCPP